LAPRKGDDRFSRRAAREMDGLKIDDYPGLRLLRSLFLGYHLAPLQGFDL